MKKIGVFVFLLFSIVLASCGRQNNVSHNNLNKKQVNLPVISTTATTGIFVSVSDSHMYSHKWPLAVSGSYYFNPIYFYVVPSNFNNFLKAYSTLWSLNKVYYYDENGWAQAWLVVYVLRNYFKLKNVSLLENAKLNSMLKYWQKIRKIPIFRKFLQTQEITWGYIWTGKYLIVYNPFLIHFKTGDLLLYSSDIWTMKESKFYQNSTWVNIESFDWSKLLTINKWLKSKDQIKRLLKPLQLQKYKRIFIYYPKYWYRSGVLALYLQENYK